MKEKMLEKYDVKNNTFDYIRIIAAILVIFYHAWILFLDMIIYS